MIYINKVRFRNHLFIALSITSFMSLHGMMDHIKKAAHTAYANPTVYNKGVKIIDITANALSNFIVWFAYVTHRKETSAQQDRRQQLYEAMIDRRLNQIENKLRKKEKDSIERIYQDFNVPEEKRKKFEFVMTQYKQFAQEYMAYSHEENKTGVLFDSTVLSIFTVCGIDPHGIKAIISRSLHPEENDTWVTASNLDADVHVDADGVITINKVLTPPAITLYPPFFKLSIVGQKHAIANSLARHAAHHLITRNCLIGASPLLLKVTSQQMVNNKNYNDLLHIHERQAEILHKDQAWASIARETRKSYFDPGHFLGLYAQLVEIDELHKLKDKLKNYRPIPVQKVPATKFNGLAPHL